MNPLDRLLCRRLLVLEYTFLMKAVVQGKLTHSDLWPALYFLGMHRQDVFDPESGINLAIRKHHSPAQFRSAHTLVCRALFQAQVLGGVIWPEGNYSHYNVLNTLLKSLGHQPVRTDDPFSVNEVKRRVEKWGVFSPLKVLTLD